MMRAEMRVGRLLEVRATLPICPEETPELIASFTSIFRDAPPLVVAILDARSYGLEPPEAAAHFVDMMRRDNARIERSAFLIEPHQSLLALQLERLIREAGNPRRRLFRSPAAAAVFLDPVLSAAEYARLDLFLAENDGDAAAEALEATPAQRRSG